MEAQPSWSVYGSGAVHRSRRSSGSRQSDRSRPATLPFSASPATPRTPQLSPLLSVPRRRCALCAAPVMSTAALGGDDLSGNCAVDEQSRKTSKKRKAEVKEAEEGEGAATTAVAVNASKRRRKGQAAATASTSPPLPFLSREEQAKAFWRLCTDSRPLTAEEAKSAPLPCPPACRALLSPSRTDPPLFPLSPLPVSRGPLGAESMVAVPLPTAPSCAPSHTLAQLPSVLRRALPSWRSILCSPPSSSPPSQPFVLCLCSSALRCQAVVKALRPLPLPPQSLVKAYARHFKLEEQQRALQSHDVRLVVGTPHRVRQLMDCQALLLTRLRLLLLDCSEDGQFSSLSVVHSYVPTWSMLN